MSSPRTVSGEIPLGSMHVCLMEYFQISIQGHKNNQNQWVNRKVWLDIKIKFLWSIYNEAIHSSQWSMLYTRHTSLN